MSLEKEFHKDMLDIYQQALKHCDYRATRFLQMIANEGGLQTAKKLLSDNKISDGFLNLLECKRLDLTVEALVTRENYRCLFTQEEIQEANQRLTSYNYNFEKSLY